jgi:hypothetical protein
VSVFHESSSEITFLHAEMAGQAVDVFGIDEEDRSWLSDAAVSRARSALFHFRWPLYHRALRFERKSQAIPFRQPGDSVLTVGLPEVIKWAKTEPENRRRIMYTLFEKAGKENSERALEVLAAGIERYEVNQAVIASTYGDTGLAAARLLQGREVELVVVTHNYGFREPGRVEMSADVRAELEAMGVRVHTGTMPFRNVGTAIREKLAYSQQDLIANTLRLFGQGIKVCVEIVLMAADAGLIRPANVLAVAGTGRGADTVALIAPQSSNKLFDLKVRDILAKPLDW